MWAALFATLSVLPAQTATPLDGSGPYAVGSEQRHTFSLPSGDVTGDLYWPTNATTPAPIVVVGHGFARNAARMTNWGDHLASWGFVVAVPSFPSPLSPDHVANALTMRELVALLRQTPGPVTAMIDPTKAALVGHSAGGLSTFLAIADDPTFFAAVALDPVDANNLGVQAAPRVTVPTLVLGAAPSSCNSNGSSAALYAALTARESWFLRVIDATHCDAEDPTNGTCTFVCGGDDVARRSLFRRYATAHLLAHLRCEGLASLPGGADLARDLAAQVVGELAQTAGNVCAGSADAGVSAPDASVPRDAGSAPADAATAADAGSPVPADSGVSLDGGSVQLDATTGEADAGSTIGADAGASAGADAASTGGSDAGSASGGGGGGTSSDGCTCAARPTGDAPIAAVLAIAVLGLGLVVARRAPRRTR